MNGQLCLNYPSSFTARDQSSTPCGAGHCRTAANALCLSGVFPQGWNGSPSILTLAVANLQMPATTEPIVLTVISRTADGYSIDQATASLQSSIGSATLNADSTSPIIYSSTVLELTLQASLQFNKVKVTVPDALTFSAGQPVCQAGSVNTPCSYESASK